MYSIADMDKGAVYCVPPNPHETSRVYWRSETPAVSKKGNGPSSLSGDDDSGLPRFKNTAVPYVTNLPQDSEINELLERSVNAG